MHLVQWRNLIPFGSVIQRQGASKNKNLKRRVAHKEVIHELNK